MINHPYPRYTRRILKIGQKNWHFTSVILRSTIQAQFVVNGILEFKLERIIGNEFYHPVQHILLKNVIGRRDDKIISYIQAERKDLSVAITGLRRQVFQSAGSTLRNNKWWYLYKCREYEFIIQSSSPWASPKANYHEFEFTNEKQLCKPASREGLKQIRRRFSVLSSEYRWGLQYM